MFAFLKPERAKEPQPIAKLTEAELKNVLEQERIINNAIQTQMMLMTSLNMTMKQLAVLYKLPNLFELDRETGEIFKKESSDG